MSEVEDQKESDRSEAASTRVDPIGIGVIGYGYWGPNLVRNFVESERTNVIAVSDLSQDKLRTLSKRYSTLETTVDCSDMLSNSEIDAIVIATPVRSHYALAKAALEAGKHVLIAKPMTETAAQARSLVEEAERRNLVLMVDHTFVYTPAVRMIRELVKNGELGDILYYDSTRINLGLFQHDVDVIWDLASHDLSIISYVMDEQPVSVSANSISHFAGQPANIAFLTLLFASGAVAHVNVNWLAPLKVRRSLIGGSRRMIVYDDMEADQKIKVFDKGVTLTEDPEQIYEMLVGYRTGDMWAPRVDHTEALSIEVAEFAHSICEAGTTTSNGNMGLRIVEILEAATLSAAQGGTPVDINHLEGQE